MTRLFIIDALNYIFRSYWGLPPMKNPKGQATQALYGMIRGIQKIQKEFSPSHIVVVFDGPDNSRSRRELYPEYKSHRSAPPEDLIPQIGLAHQALDLMGISKLELEGVEADDTIGSIAKWATKEEIETYICSSDKDLCQLINEHITLLQPHKNLASIKTPEFEAKYGIAPTQMIDYLAIVGDSSDNIPGLSGFGPKTASNLLKSCLTIEKLKENPEQYLKGKKLETFYSESEKLEVSRKLATIDTDLSIPTSIDFYTPKETDKTPLNDFYIEMGFKSLVDTTSTPISQPKQSIEQAPTSYTLIDSEKACEEAVQKLMNQSTLVIDLETTSLDTITASIVGIGICYQKGHAFYFPFNGNLEPQWLKKTLSPLLSHDKIQWIGHNIKFDYKVLVQNGFAIKKPFFDTMVASYLINPEGRRHGLDHLCLEHLEHTKIETESLIGKGKKQISFWDVPVEKTSDYCCEDVDFTWRLYELFEPQLKEKNLWEIFKSIEMPLVPILAQMELQGIQLEREVLDRLAVEVNQDLKVLEEAIYSLADEEFNINSPKQLSHILFEKLELPPPKKTKTGSYSTNVDVLTQLSKDYPIALKILDYRALEKLRSTYIEKLPQSVNSQTGKIHCSFSQTTAATGRLASTDPNLQNIPVRTELGRSIRKAFIPSQSDYVLVSADYSQIELRLLAHFSQDPNLLEAFNNKQDIHTHTASQIFHTPLEAITPEMRYRAKAVNFGVIYGQKPFGLAQELNIPVKEAGAFIKKYFEQYPSIDQYLKNQIQETKDTGFTKTYLGRIRPISDINSKNGILRSAAERLAINTPLQGSAADLIKEAMITMDKLLPSLDYSARLLLQVHDELIYEVPKNEAEKFSQILKTTMETIWNLSIPLEVNVAIADNWKDLK